MALRIPYRYSLFPIILAALSWVCNCWSPAPVISESLRLSSLHGLLQISFASSFSTPHWLVKFIRAHSYISFSCLDSVIHLSLYCHRKMRMFILADFIPPLIPLFRHMRALEGYFLNHIEWMHTALI